jgi:CheY-like chemotaxis protein
MRRRDKKRVEQDTRLVGGKQLFQNYDYTEAEPNATSPGGGLYHGSMDKYKSVKEFVDKRRKQNRKKRMARKQAMQNRMGLLQKLAIKMRILVIDDDPTRHEGFDRALRDQEVTHVYNYREAVKALESSPAFDIVYFDHDLGDYGPSPSGYGSKELTGCDIALYIARVLPEEKRPKFAKIHSWNPAGAANIAAVLNNAGIPFERETYGEPEGEEVQVIWTKPFGSKQWNVYGEFTQEELPKELECLSKGIDQYIVLPFGKEPANV